MERDPMEIALSTDVVMDVILSHLKVRDLLSCRLASKFWNKAATSVLRKRSTITREIRDEEDLMELQQCMRNGSDLPFAGLELDLGLCLPWRFNSGRAMEFFQNHGERFTRLRLNVLEVTKLHALAPFINYLPRLSILELGPSDIVPEEAPSVVSDALQEDPKILKLQSLRTLRFVFICPEVNEDGLREIFTAASPSLHIECEDASAQVLRALKNAGKLRAISSITFDYSYNREIFELESVQNLTESPSLTKLVFSTDGCLSIDGLKKILFSSQHTLKELHLDGTNMGSLWKEFPVFTKLNTLSLRAQIDNNSCKHLFRGRHGHKFPALKELSLAVSCKGDENLGPNFSDGLFIVPSVTRIDLVRYASEGAMKQLSQSFPNLIEIGLKYEYYSGLAGWGGICGNNPFEIWSVGEFKHLEKLRIWDFIVKPPTKSYINLDSFLTGIPAGICGNLHKKDQLVLNLKDCPFSEELSEALRENPSILELKNLRELLVCVKPADGLKELPDGPPFMSMISVWYALEMMPNLEAKFVYEDPSPPWRTDNCGNAVLEAAFKHVKPFVKLERLS